MPEGDTIFRASRSLNKALAGQLVTGFETVLPKLSRADFDAPVTGRTVESVKSRGKWMFMTFSGDLVLLTHMLMNGSWHIYRPGERWRRPQVSRKYDQPALKSVATALIANPRMDSANTRGCRYAS